MKYNRYYKHLSELPKFKSKKNPVQSYTNKNNKTSKDSSIRIENKHIIVPKLKKIKFETSDKQRPQGNNK